MPSMPGFRVLVLLSFLIIAAAALSESFAAEKRTHHWHHHYNPRPVNRSKKNSSRGVAAEVKRTDDVSSLKIQKAVKQILTKGDAKTLIFARDSTFNFFPSKFDAHIDIHKIIKIIKTGAVAKGKKVIHSSRHVTPSPSAPMTTDNNHPVATTDNEESSTTTEKQNGDDAETTATVEEREFKTTSPADGIRSVRLTDVVEEQLSVTERQILPVVSDGSETVREGGAGDGKTGVDRPRPQIPTVTVDDEAENAGRIRDGKYVYIKSMLPMKNPQAGAPDRLVLDMDFEDNQAEDGSRKIVLSVNDQALSEHWYIDNTSNVIRNRRKNLCISFSTEKGQLIASPCSVTDTRQTWLYDAKRNTLHNPQFGLVADVAKPSAEVGGVIRVKPYANHPGQHFEVGTPPLYFVLVNEETGLMLSVSEGRDRPGTKLVLVARESPPGNGQLWYFDQRDVLRSKIGDSVMDSSTGIFRLEPFSTETFDTTSWTFFDRQIVNLKDDRQVMEPVATKYDDGLVLAPRRRYDDKRGQRFKIIYISQDGAATPALPASKKNSK